MPPGNTPFPLSRYRVMKEWSPDQDPLDVLHPHEIRAAELYASLWLDPNGPPHIRGPAVGRLPWATQFRETFGIELTTRIKFGLHQNPAWNAYLKKLKHSARDVVMAKIQQDSLDAYEDHKWARKEAKRQGDYKETRLAASDHLDRLGATLKPAAIQQNVVVMLKSPNFEPGKLLRELPALEAEVVEDKPAD